ncbi:hypothetical protein RvY_02302-2 [Ramazzottius varieornatus]|uniref:Uncharacterized protein n=1 Tax=Ramazzottius varieornatus TaxID=947166 RepID=A0A1D1UK13_RAMVA|nr:hypothetical protein RvY_02302-2 [Ramazzottius varieornatus]
MQGFLFMVSSRGRLESIPRSRPNRKLLTCDMLLGAFSKKIAYYRKSLPSWKKCATKKTRVVRSNDQKEVAVAEPTYLDLSRSASESETNLSEDEAIEHSEGSLDDEPVVAKKVRKSARSTKKNRHRMPVSKVVPPRKRFR